MTFDPLTFTVERGHPRAFAGRWARPIHSATSVDAAVAAGDLDVPTPHRRFFFSMGLEVAEAFGYLEFLGVDKRFVLHGEQPFDYHAMA